MMNVLLTILFGLGISGAGYGQMTLDSLLSSDTIYNAYQHKMEEVFDSVDFSFLSTGILYDRGFSYINMESFDGTLTDEGESSMLAFGLAYASIASMTVADSVALPDPSSYRIILDTVTSESNVILIAGLHQQYDRIDSNSISDGLFSQSAANLSDVLPRAESPYNKERLFLFAASENSIQHSQFKFRFDSQLFYDNYGISVDSLRIDMGNGGGYMRAFFDQDIDALYGSGGRKNVKVELTYLDGTVLYSHFDIIVGEPGNRAVTDAIPDYVYYIPETGTSPTDRGGGDVNVYLACGHTSIEKPFIWAEAYNPDVGSIEANLTPAVVFERINHIDGEIEEKRLWDHLLENGYDIIILDYDDGGDYLPRTAEFIKEVLRWVNDEKEASGSNEKNVILGQSMGGVCTTQALKEMENDGEDHEVETFIVFDSPIMGVNIPLAAQASVYDIAFTQVTTPITGAKKILMHYVEAIEDAVRILNVPATRTMVTYLDNGLKMYDVPVRDFLDDIFGIEQEHLYPDHYDYLHNEMGGLPTECEVLTITNGSRHGESGEHNFEAGDLIVHSEVDNFVIMSLLSGAINEKVKEDDLEVINSPRVYSNGSMILWLGGFNTNVDIKMYAAQNSPDFQYYDSHIGVHLFWDAFEIIMHEGEAKGTGLKEIDHAPGGFFGAGNQGIVLNPDTLGVLMPTVFNMTTWCFTPTGSVLNYESPTSEVWWDVPLRSYTSNYTDIGAHYVRGVDAFLSNSETRSWGTGSTYKNTAHTWFTQENAYFLLFHLKGADELSGVTSLTSGTTYNFGNTNAPDYDIDEGETYVPFKTWPFIDHSMTIDNTSMSINANDVIGLTPTPYVDDLGNASDDSHFTVNIGPICDPFPAIEVVVDNDAEITLGDGINRSGSLHVQDGHSITVDDGGTIRVKKGGMLKLMEGGILIIKNGGKIILEEDAKLMTQEGSIIYFHDGGDIQLNGNDTELRLKGKLYLFENAVFSPTHDGVTSGMVVIDNPEGTLIAEDNSVFEIMGDGDDDPMLTINDNGQLRSLSNMEMMRFASCKIFIRNEGSSILSISPFTSVDVSYDVQSNLVDADVHPYIKVYGKSLITSCTFQDVKLRAVSDLPLVDGYFLNMNNTDFDYSYAKSEDQVYVLRGAVNFYNCNFDGFQDRGVLLEWQTSYSQIQNCNFTAGDYYPYSIALTQKAASELYVNNCTFDLHKTAIDKSFGKLRLKCNNFSNSFGDCIVVGTNGELEMATNAGYNKFTAIGEHNVRLHDAQTIHVNNGYNDFHEQASYPMFKGGMQLGGYYYTMMLAQRNKWNPANTSPDASEFVLWSEITGASVGVNTFFPQTEVCGAEDPSEPYVDLAGGAGSYLPTIPISGQSTNMRLDSALSFAGSSTKLWDANQSDAVAIDRFYDILTYQYTTQQLADTATNVYLDMAFHWMKHTVNHALTDSTILVSNNQNGFNTSIQQYVDVLNAMTSSDTIAGSDYVRRFYIELDKAHLFRSLGYTNMGLNILQNVNLCILDSNEQIAMNQWLFVFEEELAWQQVGDSLYGVDTTFTDISGYAQPVNNQITETYFGSVINGVSSISYKSCTGSKNPESDESQNRSYPFNLYPNPSNGEINVEYDVAEKSTAQIKVYSIDGKVIAQVDLKSGHHFKTIDISHVQSGIYIYELNVDGISVETGRISIAR